MPCLLLLYQQLVRHVVSLPLEAAGGAPSVAALLGSPTVSGPAHLLTRRFLLSLVGPTAAASFLADEADFARRFALDLQLPAQEWLDLRGGGGHAAPRAGSQNASAPLRDASDYQRRRVQGWSRGQPMRWWRRACVRTNHGRARA